MTSTERTWLVVITLSLNTPACTGTPIELETEGGGSGGSGSDTSGSNPTNPNPTNPTQPMEETGVMTGGDTTGSATTGPPNTTGEDTSTTGPAGDTCCEVHEGPGCDQPDVVDCVCAIEASCCAFEWNQDCVDLAVGDCNATCDEPGTTGDPETTTGVGNECEDIVEIEMLPSEAIHSGAWELGMSGIGEGEISVIPNPMFGTDGTILYEPDLPCDDTWYIWVRGLNFGTDDSYFATLDGMPMPSAIFEADCEFGGGGYTWAALNWRDPADPSCTYVEDPWTPTWTAGIHAIEFGYREINAMGRIVITNDPAFVP